MNTPAESILRCRICDKMKRRSEFYASTVRKDDFDKYGENPWVWVIEFKALKPASDTQSNALKILSTKELPQ